MRQVDFVDKKIIDREGIKRKIAQWRAIGKTVAFTNGCFDILHQGHIFSLSQAASEGDILIVGANSDASTTCLKGPGRPVNNEHSRTLLLASLLMTDAVVVFDEPTPLELIKAIDVTAPMDFDSEVIPIKYALASDIASALGSLGGGTSETLRDLIGKRLMDTDLTDGIFGISDF